MCPKRRKKQQTKVSPLDLVGNPRIQMKILDRCFLICPPDNNVRCALPNSVAQTQHHSAAATLVWRSTKPGTQRITVQSAAVPNGPFK